MNQTKGRRDYRRRQFEIVSHAFPWIRPNLYYCPPRKLGLASKQQVQLNKKKEGKSCIRGAKYAAREYLPPTSKMSGVTFHCLWLDKAIKKGIWILYSVKGHLPVHQSNDLTNHAIGWTISFSPLFRYYLNSGPFFNHSNTVSVHQLDVFN